MKKIFIILTLLFTLTCVGCASGDSGGSETPSPSTPDEGKGEYEQGLNVLSDDLGSDVSGHGSFNANDSTNKVVKFQFYLADVGKNNAYVTGDFTDWNTEGSKNYLLDYQVSNKSVNVFSNVYQIEMEVPNKDIELKVYLLDSDTPNYTIETFEIKQAQLNEDKTIVLKSYSFENTVNYRYDGVLLEAPFKVYDADGDHVTSFYDSVEKKDVIKESFESWSYAIHFAATNSSSKVILTVKDANDVTVFERMSKTYSHVFDGDYYVGYDTKTNCDEWVFESSRGYVVDGQGSAYVNTGKIDYDNSGYDDISSHREMQSGGYNYMFTNNGLTQNEGQLGFTYMAMNVEFSKALYDTSKDFPDGWNAYLFINPAVSMMVNGINKTIHADLGLIGNRNPSNDTIEWKLVRNSTHPEANPSFYVWGSEVVTTMSYDEELKAYTGADDLRFECITSQEGFKLIITNLTTGKEFIIDEQYSDFITNDTIEASTQYGRMLLGISYCPVRANVWSHRNKGFFKNVIVSDCVVATYEHDGDYSNSTLRDFHAGSDVMFNGFVQAPDVAGYQVGHFNTDGSIGVGSNALSYNKGDLYTVYNIDYNGI